MPNHSLGSSHSFDHLLRAYGADHPVNSDAFYLLFKGDEILALCLRYKFNPKPGEVWVGGEAEAAKWGEKLAAFKGQKSIPLYYAQKSRAFYDFRGHHLVTGDTTEPKELEQRKSPVRLSRIVFIHPIKTPAAR